ncbi:ring-1,2-phenylacetyl-CoA epoxidase subunit PaaD [Ottowia thiooxydans]|uniref:Ring-1,2-phenylacetyl-CoA epoxidase subunit PaaD n=2 Tax=Ottowia thiooxydans TaxID=219182 RepID=A0ABV2Q944_9BURK
MSHGAGQMTRADHLPAGALPHGGMPQPEFDRIWQALDELTDPEIPVITLREMGILRDVRLGTDGAVEAVITPTYSGCPAMEQIADDVAAALEREGVHGRVVTQLAPAWTTDWMTDAAREKLRAYGISPPHCASASAEGSVIQFSAARASGKSQPLDVSCPQCGSINTTEISHFGSTACKALYRCLDCMEPFDHFKRI